MAGSIFLTLFFAVFLGVGAVILGWGGWAFYYGTQAEHWPTTPGVITASDLKVDSDSDGTTYTAKIEYTYSPDGYQRTGKTIAFGYAGSSGRTFHREVQEALPVGAQVAVRYDPSKPDRAALSYGINRSIIFLLLFGGVWTVFTLGVAAMALLTEKGASKLLDHIIIY